MKPLAVLLLVLVAAGGLFLVINQLGDDSGGGADPGIVEPDAGGGTDPGAGPGQLPPPQPGERVTAEAGGNTATGDRVSTTPQDEYFANQLTGLVVNEEQRPVAKAKVTLTKYGKAQIMFQNDPQDRSSDIHVETDQEGQFRFVNVEPYDRYALEVSAPGYSAAAVADVTVGVEGSFSHPPILLTTGVKLYGTVTDSGNNLVPEATLHLDGAFFRPGTEPHPDRLTAVTDQAGRYEILNVPAGNRTLTVTADGYANTTVGGLVFQGESRERNITLEIAERIEGTVINQEGAPIEAANVLAMSFSNNNRQCRESAKTDELGRFSLERLAAGQYTIAVNAEGYRPAHESRVQTGEPGLIIELVRQATVTGRVIAGDTGNPPSRYSVRLRTTYPETNLTSPVGSEVAFSNADGSFTLTGVQPGNYVVQADAPGYAPTYSTPFNVSQGQPTKGVEVRLTLGGRITGRMVGADGPVPRPLISTHDNTWSNSLFDQALGDEFPTNATLRSLRGNAKGEFTITGLKPGALYQVRIKAPGYCEEIRQDIPVTEGQATDLGELRMSRGGKITGQVLGAAGEVLAGAVVSLNPDGRQPGMARRYKVKADAKGQYVIQNVWPGAYKLTASPPAGGGDFLATLQAGADSGMQRVNVVEGQEQRYDLKAN